MADEFPLDVVEALVEQLNRPDRLTPKPAFSGVCGHPVQGLYATLTYRCRRVTQRNEAGEVIARCNSPRLRVVPVVVHTTFRHQPVICLRCKSDQTTFEKMEFRSL